MNIEKQLEQITGRDLENLPYDKKRELVLDALHSAEFVPNKDLSNPCETELKYENEAIDGYCESLRWGENGWEPVDKTDILKQYPEYIPTDESIEILQKYSPILEIGAGDGYWANILDNAGVSILATDINPKDANPSDFPDDYWKSIGTQKYQFISVERDSSFESARSYHPIHIADHTCIKSYPSHTILLCHPPVSEWTEEVLELCHLGQELVFVGEWYPGADATPKFFNQLLDNWECVEKFPVYDWASMHAHGYVFKKRDAR